MNRRQAIKTIATLPAALAVAPTLAGKTDAPHVSLPDLMRAIEHVESGGDPSAIGDGGAAVGILQLHEGFVDDCNRIDAMIHSDYGTRWRYESRYRVIQSRDMFTTWHLYYAFHTGDITAEGIARRHNGGPRGHTKAATLPYWAKVKARLYR